MNNNDKKKITLKHGLASFVLEGCAVIKIPTKSYFLIKCKSSLKRYFNLRVWLIIVKKLNLVLFSKAGETCIAEDLIDVAGIAVIHILCMVIVLVLRNQRIKNWICCFDLCTLKAV